MMKKMILLTLAAAAMIAACDRPDPAQEKTEENTFTISSADFPITWQETDKVKLFNTKSLGSIGTASLTAGAGTTSGTFAMEKGPDAGLSARIIYPSSLLMLGKNKLPAEQEQSAAGAIDISKYAYCYSDDFTTGGAINVNLNHAMAYLRICIAASGMDGYQISRAAFRCDGKALAGGYKFDCAGKEFTPSDDAVGEVEVKLAEPLAISSEPKEIWFVMFPCELEGESAEIDLDIAPAGATTASTMTMSFSAHNLVAGNVATLSIADLSNADIEKGDPSASVEYKTQKINFQSAPSKAKQKIFDTYEARTVAGMNRMDKVRAGFSNQDKWGGYDGVKPSAVLSTNPAGFWRTGLWHDRTVMVDPDGNVAILKGMNYVCPEPMCASSTSATRKFFESKYTDMNVWASDAASILEQTGFNMYMVGPSVAGNYRYDSNRGYGVSEAMDELLHNPSENTKLSQVEWLNFIIEFWWGYKNIGNKAAPSEHSPWLSIMFDPEYLSYIDGIASEAIPKFKDRKDFIGYYSDNEIYFDDTGSRTDAKATLKNFLGLNTLPVEGARPRYLSYAYDWAVNWMKTNYGTTEYSSSMEPAFMTALADYYYKTASETIRRYDRNHLYLGSRLHADSKHDTGVLEACARYCDVISINCYMDLFDPDAAYFGNTLKAHIGQKPFLISEFYVKDMVSDPKFVNEGAGDFVDSQKARGVWYSNFCIKLIEAGNCAGWQWFKFWDDWYENGYVNKGIVRYDETGLYTECTNLMAELNRNVYQVLSYYTDLNYTPDTPTPPAGGEEQGLGGGHMGEVIWE